LSRDLTSLDDMRAELGPLVEEVWHYCDSMGVRGRTVTLKVKFADFQIITRSRSHQVPISDRSTLASISAELVAAQFPMRKGVRLIGVSPSSLCADAADVDTQMTLALSVRPHRRAVEYSPPIWDPLFAHDMRVVVECAAGPYAVARRGSRQRAMPLVGPEPFEKPF